MTDLVERQSTPEATDGTPKLSREDLRAAATKGGLWTLLNVGVSTPLAFIANAVIARFLGVVDYGRLATLTAVISVASSVLEFGVSDGAMLWGSKMYARGERRQALELLQKTTGFRLLVYMPLMLTVIVVLAHGQPWLVITGLCADVITSAVFGATWHAYAVEHRSADGAKIGMATGALVQVATSTVAVLTHNPLAVWGARAGVKSAAAPLNLLSVGTARWASLLIPRMPVGMPQGLWRYALASMATGVLGVLVFSRSEVFVLSSYDQTAALGLFALAFGLSQQVTAPLDALAAPLAPAVSAVFDDDPDQAGQALLRLVRMTAILSGVLIVVSVPVIFGTISLVYGEHFAPAAYAFVPLAMTSFAQSVVNPVLAFTRARERADIVLRLTLLALVVDVALVAAGAPFAALTAAVVANIAGFAVVLVGGVMVECRALEVPGRDMLHAFIPLAASAGVCTVAVAVTSLVLPQTSVFLPMTTVLLASLLWFAYARACITREDSAEVRRCFARLPRPLQGALTLSLAVLLPTQESTDRSRQHVDAADRLDRLMRDCARGNETDIAATVDELLEHSRRCPADGAPSRSLHEASSE